MWKTILSLAILASVLIDAVAQNPTPAEYLERVKALKVRPEAIEAFEHVDRKREDILEEWAETTDINAPPGQVKQRADHIHKLLKKLKLQDIHYDSLGNLIAVRKGTGGGPKVVFDAHMDTVFQPGLKIKTKIRDGK